MSDEKKGLLPVPASVETLGSTQDVDEVMAVLERRNKLMERVLSYAIQATDPRQWVTIGDRPWPTGPACEAMARRCGASWERVMSEKRDTTDEHGPSYTWTYRARFYLRGGFDTIEAEGHCSSHDQFLGDNFGEGPRLFHEIDEGNIRQAAYTNMVVNGVTRLLGVRNLSKDRLDALLGGIQGGTVEFNKGSRGGGERSQPAGDVALKFGKGKGKNLSEVEDADVKWYIGCWEKDLANPEKKKFHKNAQKNIEIGKALLASRAAGGGTATTWQRIVAFLSEHGVTEEKEVRSYVKAALNLPEGTKPQDLPADAFDRVKEAVGADEKSLDEGAPL